MASLRSFFRDERGATAIEYAFIAGLISIAIFAGLAASGPKLNLKFTTIANALN